MTKRKRCPKCGRNRLEKFFYKNRANRRGLASYCIPCYKEYDTPNKKRKMWLQSRYGITLEEYEKILKLQHYQCGACGKHESECKTRLCVDHCHHTGSVRGLLCHYCNRRVLGRHTLERLRGVVHYLENPPAFHVIGQHIVPKRKRRKRG